ncbi:MAG: MIP/aquaporin family protein [Thermoanaerobaculia bacterium]
MVKYATELIGTFFLVLTIGLVVLGDAPLGALAIGAVLMVMVYMGGHISGAHYNPAVSLSLALAGEFPTKQLVPYWIAQLAGALAAACVVWSIHGRTFAPAPDAQAPALAPWLIEILFTFALCLVVLNVATHSATKGNSYYGLAIGFTIAAAVIAGGPMSGGAFNPAVGVGPTILHAASGAGSWAPLLLYIVGPALGGALAAYVFRAQE